MSLLERLQQEDLIFGVDGYDAHGFLERWERELSLLERVTEEDPVCSYHNYSHLVGTGMIMEKLISQTDNSPAQMFAGVIAAIYHDFRYGGFRNDDDNIKATCDSFIKMNKNLMPESIKFIIDTIAQTRYPYNPATQLSYTGKVLRDADRLYGQVFCSPEMINRLYLALGHKLNIYTLEEFVTRNLEFVKTFESFSQEGKVLYEQTKERSIDLHLKMLNIYN